MGLKGCFFPGVGAWGTKKREMKKRFAFGVQPMKSKQRNENLIACSKNKTQCVISLYDEIQYFPRLACVSIHCCTIKRSVR